MSLFFVTGISGSGKSTITHELRARGYEAYDTDDDGFARWQNDKTGYIHPKSSVKKEDRTAEFLKEHSWKVQRDQVEELALKAKDKPIFLCGVVGNTADFLDLFKAVFALTLDEATIKHRLTNRTNNNWGKQPHELKQTLSYQDYLNDLYQKMGFIEIDATQPVKTVVDTILQKAEL
jgi:adenylate kinase family enzyme